MDALSADTADLDHPQSLVATRNWVFALQPILMSDPQFEYCLRLAHQNMSPYLERRGEQFNDVRWRELAPQAGFYLIVEDANSIRENVGFVSVRGDPDCPPALHIGDVQVEAAHQNRGAGSAALQWIEDRARSRGLTELTLNVFRDNPAIRLYERFGFQLIDTQFYKYKMRKTLVT
jgi:ribosomal protein S18 acetylase RimI-like enzyme